MPNKLKNFVGTVALSSMFAVGFVGCGKMDGHEMEVINKNYRPSETVTSPKLPYPFGEVIPYKQTSTTYPSKWIVIVRYRNSSGKAETKTICVGKEYFDTLKIGDTITFDRKSMSEERDF